MKLGYVIAYVPDVRAALGFYQTAFDLPQRFLDESGQYGELDAGAVPLCFAAQTLAAANGVDTVPLDPARPTSIEIAFVADDVPSAVTRAVNAGAVLVKEPEVKPWGQTVAYVRDPFGILVELCTPMGG